MFGYQRPYRIKNIFPLHECGMTSYESLITISIMFAWITWHLTSYHQQEQLSLYIPKTMHLTNISQWKYSTTWHFIVASVNVHLQRGWVSSIAPLIAGRRRSNDNVFLTQSAAPVLLTMRGGGQGVRDKSRDWNGFYEHALREYV